jgi:hypothetical protein
MLVVLILFFLARFCQVSVEGHPLSPWVFWWLIIGYILGSAGVGIYRLFFSSER